MASAVSDLGLHCLSVILNRVSRLQWVVIFLQFKIKLRKRVYSRRDGRHGTLQAKETLKSHERRNFVPLDRGDNLGCLRLR